MMREDEQTEFKKTTRELNEAMVSVSAMLNKHKQGKVYFGLKNDGTPNPFTITDSTLRDVSRKIYESIKPQLIPVVEVEEIDGVEVIVLTFSGEDVPYSAFGKYYIRIADEDRELSPSELRKIMIRQEYEENWENKSTDQTLDDVDDKTIEEFYDSAISCGRLPEIEYDKRKILDQLGVLNGDHLTNAGVCLFSAKKPIALKMAVFATDHKDTFLDLSRAEGNIFELIDTAVTYIVKNIRWRVEMNEDGIHRKEIPEIPIDAIREAVINSFAHARYDLSVQHEIAIFSNRISICNPGSFANDFEPIDFYTRDIRSYLRNEVIARTLYLCKDVETFGSGIRKIYTLCNEAKVAVSYINEETAFTIEFSRFDRNISPENGVINGEINDRISEAEMTLLSILKESPSLTSAELSESTGKSERTISRLLAALKNKKLIQRIGSNKTGYWLVI
ncbi:MAG: putative DNA binding domain-containing protein [Erysipelotrichaceae bacterium]|nr:putative DNA binding domain-containing protein [Erysipelotrichaceae bacterium]